MSRVPFAESCDPSAQTKDALQVEHGFPKDVISSSNMSLMDRIMRDYRAFELGPDGQITSRFDFSARDDEAAKKQARQVASGDGLELWRRDRKVAEWRGQRPTWLKMNRSVKSPN